MLEIYFTEACSVNEKLNELLSGRIPFPFKISKTENGKPYIEGNPLFFSVSHSKSKAIIALCDKPVGVDMEVITDRKYNAVISRLCAEETDEIKTLTDFLKHWTVREAYIKMSGYTIAEKFKLLKYVNGKLYDEKKEAGCEITVKTGGEYVYAVCIDKRP